MNPFAQPRPKASVLDAIEGYYLASTLNHLHRVGLLEQLRGGSTVERLGCRFGYTPDLLAALLEFLVQRTELVTRSGDEYQLAETFADEYFLGFQLDKFIGGYGPAITRLEESLRREDRGCSLVNRAVESEAYGRFGPPPNPVVLAIMKTLTSRALLDIGCGPATTLTALAERDAAFRGWGVDVVESMCHEARARISRFGFEDRIKIIHADGRDLASVLPADLREQVEVVHCKSVVNEFFGGGDSGAVAFLRSLRALFSKRLLLNVDYYGKLGRVDAIPSQYRHTVVHDVIQALTGQGVPPQRREEWLPIYEAAGVRLEHVFEGDDSGIEWFVHVVEL
ncbi:SAM-dependent methyltransferase [Streptomyces rishiriensis]|uniref:SAM-dependent methyltransferase n=1 Tax=Streptomyces rishiriensis TaxID=68264 RepID=UPI0033F4D7D7